tara:strand:- start:17961 stop:18989 length:1029 start_codon:yes stop_codon:yes gene_type:complete
MIFKVSKKVKGTLVLNSFKNPLTANSIVTVKGNDLYKDDIQAAIRAGILIQQKQEEEEAEYIPTAETPKVTITNNLDKRLVLGNLILPSFGSTYVPRTEVDEDVLRQAAAAKYISVIFDDENIEEQYGGYPVDTSDEFEEPGGEMEEYEEDEEDEEEDETETAEPTAVVWEATPEGGSLKDAPLVPKAKDMDDEFRDILSDETDEEEYEVEVDEVEPEDDAVVITKDDEGNVVVEEEEEVVVIPKKTVAKKKKVVAKKKAVVRKKKGSQRKSKKKVKALEPTGEVRPPKTQADAAVELDSRGKPLGEKPSDTLQQMIDEISGDDITFVDKEQDIQRLRDRMG